MKYEDLKEGQMIHIDGSNDCLKEGNHKVQTTSQDEFYVTCDHGHHLLDGHIQDGELVGISEAINE